MSTQDLFDYESKLVRQWLGAWWHQAITWTHVDKDLQCHMVSLGHNELTAKHQFSLISTQDLFVIFHSISQQYTLL